MGTFDGKVAVITGGASGIGLATARLLAAEGTSVVLAGRDEARGQTATASIVDDGGDARFVRADVANDAQVEALARQAAGSGGTIDIWFNNAGTEGRVGPLDPSTTRSSRSCSTST